MSDHNRGAYTPQSEAPLAFDARHSRGPGERPMPLTLLVSAGVLVLLVMALAFFFLKGTDDDDVKTPEPIEAMKGAPPIAEAKPAGATGLQVYADGDPIPETPAFTPAPEAPAARPTAPVTAAPLPVPATPARPATPAATPAAPAPTPATPAVPPAPAAATPRPADTPPAARPNTPPMPTSSAQVQIGAFSSAALADDGWSEVASLLPGQMAGKTKRVEPVTRNGDTLYRASVGGFASRQEAAAFCEALKARSHACLVR